jgi:hypothetical protein
MKLPYLAALTLALCACGPIALTPAGQQVRLVTGEPPTGCEEIGQVQGNGNGIGRSTAENSKIEIRNDAGRQDANIVRLETVSSQHGYLTGWAFKCPDPDAVVAAHAKPAKPAAE